jgi:hypothetical protein
MKKTFVKRLVVSAMTLRKLGEPELAKVAGARNTIFVGCTDACTNTCGHRPCTSLC